MVIPEGQEYAIIHGDCIPTMASWPESSVDCVICSVPFPSMFSYTSFESDLGNSEDLRHEMKLHFSWFYRQMCRVLKPGRVACIHVMQIPRMKRTGGVGLHDFRGFNIRIGERAGLIYEYDWSIRKGPQGQAIRTKSRALQFVGLEDDRAKSRGALADYLIKFVKPGDNETPIDSEDQVSRNQWIDWAEGCWEDIRETDTLNVAAVRTENETRHICCLQVKLIDRAIRLFSNPGEIVMSPFAGIGSEIYTALKLGRRGLGIELKNEYHAEAIKNCDRAIREREADNHGTLFDLLEIENAAERKDHLESAIYNGETE